MKKQYFLNLILICVIAASLFVFTKAICDNDDTLLDTPPHEGYSCSNKLLKSPLSQTGVLSGLDNARVLRQEIISYLERQEKSPPSRVIIPSYLSFRLSNATIVQ